MKLEDLEIYALSRKISRGAWEIYKNFDWQDRKIIGDQFISSIDSISANIAEGFGRFHYLDKNKFNYNSRGSLLEGLHWLELLHERDKIKEDIFLALKNDLTNLHRGLNSYINSTKNQVDK